MNQYLSTFVFAHSIFRYLVLLSTLSVAVQCLIGMMKKSKFKASHKRSALIMQIMCDIQLLLGLAVFYLGHHLQSFKDGTAHQGHYNLFYNIEHPVSMILGIIMVHTGYAVTKAMMDDDRKFKRMFWCSFVALFFFMAQTPWPGMRDVGRPLIPKLSTAQ